MGSKITAFLFVHIQGDPLTGDERLSAFGQVLSQAAEANLDIVIHDDTPGTPLAPDEYISRANYLGASQFKKRIAYVPPPGFPSNTCELIENAAWNYARKVRLFSHVEDAIDWIDGPEEGSAQPL